MHVLFNFTVEETITKEEVKIELVVGWNGLVVFRKVPGSRLVFLFVAKVFQRPDIAKYGRFVDFVLCE